MFMERFREKKIPAPIDVKYAIKKSVGKRRFEYALDAGCGSGRYMDFLETFCDRVVGIDIDPNLKRKNTMKMSMTNIKFPDNTFDLVFSTDVIIHIYPDLWDRVIEELYRVAKDGAIILILSPNQYAFTRILQKNHRHFLDPDHKTELNLRSAFKLSNKLKFKGCKAVVRGYSSYGKTNMLNRFWRFVPHKLGEWVYYFPPLARGYIIKGEVHK